MYLLPETVTHQDGCGPELNLHRGGRPLLLHLGITRILEDESLDVSIWGSEDRRQWRKLAAFPQKFYCGDYYLTLDLSRYPEIKHLRAQWKMNCRRPGCERNLLFGFHLTAEQAQFHHAGAY